MEIKLCHSENDMLTCWQVLLELRPHLKESEFVTTVKEMITEGYQLAFIEEEGKAVAAIGYRYLQFLYNGKHIYIDDLSVLPAYRGRGYAGNLLDYVEAAAKQKGYKSVTLDSGYQRNNAHRLYLNKGYLLSSHHFSKTFK